MAIQQITIPDIGDFDSVEIIEILVSAGDTVAVDDSLLTLESDKATMEIPSPVAGTVKKVAVSIGDSVSEGDYVLDIEVSGDAAAPAEEKPAEKAPETPKPAPAADAPKPEPVPQAAPPVPVAPVANKLVNAQSMGAKSHASPSVRSFARKLGVDLSNVSGTGPKGRIQQNDVEAAIKAVMSGQKRRQAKQPAVRAFLRFRRSISASLAKPKPKSWVVSRKFPVSSCTPAG